MKASDLHAAETLADAESSSDVEAGPVAFDDAKIAYVVERCYGKSVLDLGCVMHDPRRHVSRYWLHRAIDDVAADLVGLDLSEAGVAGLRGHGYDVVVGDAEAFGFERKFDVVVAGDIIEHLGNPGGLIESSLGVLQPGGCLIVQTPNPWYWRNIVKAVARNEVSNNPEHTCWFDPRTLRQLAGRYGLYLTDIEFQSRYARDRYMPLPRGIKHTSWSATLVRRD